MCWDHIERTWSHGERNHIIVAYAGTSRSEASLGLRMFPAATVLLPSGRCLVLRGTRLTVLPTARELPVHAAMTATGMWCDEVVENDDQCPSHPASR